jgi:hypothetical protein
MTYLDGSFALGMLPPLGEYIRRYFRFFIALWNDSRVDGLMMIDDLAMRLGCMNKDKKPRTVRSWVVRFGALWRDLLWIINCCFRSRFSAMMERPPPVLASLARVLSRWNSK